MIAVGRWVLASNSFAYSSGTGAEIGSDSAWVTTYEVGLSSLISSVLSSGVVIPAMSGAPPVGLSAASFWASSNPTMSERYDA